MVNLVSIMAYVLVSGVAAQAAESHPYFVTMTGSVKNCDLGEIKDHLNRIDLSHRYQPNYIFHESHLTANPGYTRVFQDLLLLECTSQQMKDFLRKARSVVGLRTSARRVSSVQVHVWLEVRNHYGRRLANLWLGPAGVSGALTNHHLGEPFQYLFQDSSRAGCTQVDATCLKALKRLGHLDHVQSYQFETDYRTTLQFATNEQVLRFLFKRALSELDRPTQRHSLLPASLKLTAHNLTLMPLRQEEPVSPADFSVHSLMALPLFDLKPSESPAFHPLGSSYAAFLQALD